VRKLSSSAVVYLVPLSTPDKGTNYLSVPDILLYQFPPRFTLANAGKDWIALEAWQGASS
jgi:hypothetical protein